MRFVDKCKTDFGFVSNPFKHVVVDNFIKDNELSKLLEELDELTIDKSYYFGCSEFEKNKYAFNKNFGENLSGLFAELNSDEFIGKVEDATGTKNIVRGVLGLEGAGVHKVLNGGSLCMHRDFEGYHSSEHGFLKRELKLLLYMNGCWCSEFNGELCLYDKTSGKITKKIQPILNRCVIFETPGNIHGHPSTLKIPEGMARQSIAIYYYVRDTSRDTVDPPPVKPVMWYPGVKDECPTIV